MTAPLQTQAFANGMLVEADTVEDEKTQLRTVHYKLQFRCPSYLICFAIGEFIVVKDGDVHGIPVAYIAPKGIEESSLRLSFEFVIGYFFFFLFD